MCDGPTAVRFGKLDTVKLSANCKCFIGGHKIRKSTILDVAHFCVQVFDMFFFLFVNVCFFHLMKMTILN